MGRLTLITGGARSGKSSFAEKRIAEVCSSIAYIATARAGDAEMEDRIRKHKEQRPASWATFEESLAPSTVLDKHHHHFDGFLLDCLTVLTTNIIFSGDTLNWDAPAPEELNSLEAKVLDEIERILATTSNSTHLFAVTNEVGLGIVPATPLSRFFRDCCGRVNQRMAEAADEVFLVVSGIPVQIKGA